MSDENDCSDCPFHNTSQKYNKCMNDFIAEKILKGNFEVIEKKKQEGERWED